MTRWQNGIRTRFETECGWITPSKRIVHMEFADDEVGIIFEDFGLAGYANSLPKRHLAEVSRLSRSSRRLRVKPATRMALLRALFSGGCVRFETEAGEMRFLGTRDALENLSGIIVKLSKTIQPRVVVQRKRGDGSG